jgi:hypothetical protein
LAARIASDSASARMRLASPSPVIRVFSASAWASVWICAACCWARAKSALPWFDWTLIEISDSVSSVCCLARASASRSSRSLAAARSWRE